MYSERPIHGGVYEARPDVMAVVHNHSPAVVPFGVTGVPLRPMFHMGAVAGEPVPVWDIRDNFTNTSLLVTTMEQGRDLAATVGPHNAALMRGHGCVVVGSTLKQAVMRSVYLQANARLLLASLALGEGDVPVAERDRADGREPVAAVLRSAGLGVLGNARGEGAVAGVGNDECGMRIGESELSLRLRSGQGFA